MIGWILGTIAVSALLCSDDKKPGRVGSYGNGRGSGNKQRWKDCDYATEEERRRYDARGTGSYTPHGGFERF